MICEKCNAKFMHDMKIVFDPVGGYFCIKCGNCGNSIPLELKIGGKVTEYKLDYPK